MSIRCGRPGSGFIVRTVAEGVSERELKADMEFLIKLWNEVVRRAEGGRCPALIYNDLDLLLRTVRDLFTADVAKLIIDSRSEYDRVKKFIAAMMPDFAGVIELYEGNDPIFDGFGIEIEIDRALERKVWLKSGGYLIVDEMEALTAIDVNTGRFVGKSSLEDTITKTNMEAAREVAEQLRIRSIGGMIVVDFIDMDRPHNREKVTRAFNEYLRKDRSKAAVTRISELGLIEMTRKRTRESLLHTLTEPCTACEGKGYTKSRRTVTYELFRELRRQGDLVEGDTVLRRGSPRRRAGARDDRPGVSRGDGEAAAEADRRQGARVVPRRGLRDPLAQREGAHREVGDRRAPRAKTPRTGPATASGGAAAAAPGPARRGRGGAGRGRGERDRSRVDGRASSDETATTTSPRPTPAPADDRRRAASLASAERSRAGGDGPGLLRLPRQHLPVADGGGGHAPPGQAGGARASAIAIDSAGTGDWHVGHARDQPQPGGRRGARDSALGRGAPVRAGRLRRLRPRAGDGPREPRTSSCGWRATGATAPRWRSCARSIPRAPPDAEVPDPYYGGPRGFDEVFDICERACRGLLGDAERAKRRA